MTEKQLIEQAIKTEDQERRQSTRRAEDRLGAASITLAQVAAYRRAIAKLEAEREAETASKLAEIAAFDAEIASEQERVRDELRKAGMVV